ncbi:MAG: hypothetical protein QXT45_08230 [Candidatus Bilamarchaeaceae archaeon]
MGISDLTYIGIILPFYILNIGHACELSDSVRFFPIRKNEIVKEADQLLLEIAKNIHELRGIPNTDVIFMMPPADTIYEMIRFNEKYKEFLLVYGSVHFSNPHIDRVNAAIEYTNYLNSVYKSMHMAIRYKAMGFNTGARQYLKELCELIGRDAVIMGEYPPNVPLNMFNMTID